MEIKKPQYIRKYDFIRYFTRNKDEWFWPTKKVIEYINTKTKQLTDPDDEDIDLDEFDSYDYKKENENEDMDKNDPKIYEGNLIDKESKKFIKAQFSMCRKIFDFDEMNLSNDSAFIKTRELLVNDDNFILFQPTFIYKNKAIAKPDAFIKHNGKYILVETKGTTTVKCSHLIDLTYQHIVINECLKQINTSISQYYLCLIDYRLGEKNELGFCLSEFASIVKGGYSSSNIESIKYSHEWINEKKNSKIAKSKNITYSELIYRYSKYVPQYYLKKDGTPKAEWNKFIERYTQIRLEDNFENIINELINHQVCNHLSLEPTDKYKCWFKDNDYWPNIRDYYIHDINNDAHQLFSYSGKLIKFNKVYYDFYKQNKTPQEMFEAFKLLDGNAPLTYYLRVTKNEIVNKDTKELFSELKSKKVYFDFESIILATRVVDDTLPFMQCVNQVSIIKDNGEGVNKQTKCNNLLFDPLHMDKEKYKQIVDALLPDKNNLSLCEKYSYVVFSKLFEQSRLKEMDWIINDEKYSKKIEVIISNLYDLADLFNIDKIGCVCLTELKGFYSIKKILPIVKSKQLNIYQDVGCVDYKTELEVHNGSEAQMYATKRFFNLLSDDEWNVISNNLKKYCENDVRAMVAVEYFVKQLLGLYTS